ncbi:MAG: hypothetical protein ACPHJ3_03650 [Rubripirellula sp.]
MLLERVGEGPNKILHVDQITICLNPGHKLRRLAADLQNACFSWLENQRCFIRAISVGTLASIPARFIASSQARRRSTMLFTAKPNVTVGEKSRIEFYLQQLAECIGFDRFLLPVVSRQQLMGLVEEDQRTPEQIVGILGEHLNHDVGELRVQLDPQQAADCSGGG